MMIRIIDRKTESLLDQESHQPGQYPQYRHVRPSHADSDLTGQTSMSEYVSHPEGLHHYECAASRAEIFPDGSRNIYERIDKVVLTVQALSKMTFE